jgi:hypothetical protein
LISDQTEKLLNKFKTCIAGINNTTTDANSLFSISKTDNYQYTGSSVLNTNYNNLITSWIRSSNYQALIQVVLSTIILKTQNDSILTNYLNSLNNTTFDSNYYITLSKLIMF